MSRVTEIKSRSSRKRSPRAASPASGKSARPHLRCATCRLSTLTPTFGHACAYDDSTLYPTNNCEYTVDLTDGEFTTVCYNSVAVLPAPVGDPSIDLSLPSTIEEGQTFDVNASFSDSDQATNGPGILGWDGRAGDGNVLGGSGQVDPTAYPYPTYFNQATYSQVGTYVVTVAGYFVEDDNSGHFAYATGTIAVTEDTPTLSVASDVTAAVTGYAYTLTPTYTDELENHTPLNWTIAWGDGTSDYYAEGVALPDFTHVYATASTSGTEYSPEVTLNAANHSAGAIVASTNVLIAQPIMSVILGDGTTMAHADQQTMGGAFMAVNSNDDGGVYDANGNAIPDESQQSIGYTDPDLVEVTIQPLPAGISGTLSLTWDSSRFVVWGDSHKDTQLSSGASFDASSTIPPIYLEATGISPFLGAERLDENYMPSGGTGTPAYRIEHVLGTNFAFVGAYNVPDYSSYSYTIEGAAPNPAAMPWSATGGSVTSNTPTKATIFWDQPLNGASSGWDAHFTWHIPGHRVGWDVAVVYVNLSWPEADPMPGPGTPFDAGAGVPPQGNGIYDKLIASGNSNAPGASAYVYLSLSSPTLHPNAWKRIAVGFVQEVTSYTNEGTYKLPRGTATLKSIYENKPDLFPALDYAGLGLGVGPLARPWTYISSQSFYNGAAAAQPTKTLSWFDYPTEGPPAGLFHHATVADNEPGLTSMELSISFELDICAASFDDPGGPPTQGNNDAIYTREATSGWQFNASGSIDPKRPNFPIKMPKDAPFSMAVTVPDEWSAVNDGSRPRLTGKSMNVMAAADTFERK